MSIHAERDLEHGNGEYHHETVESRKENSRNKRKTEEALSPWESYSPTWRKLFLASCVIAVSIDPLFLYIPIINEDKKCLAMDEKMKKFALILRSVTDFLYLLHIIVRSLSALQTSREFKLSIFTRFPWLNLLNNIIAIIPLPQQARYISGRQAYRSLALISIAFGGSLLQISVFLWSIDTLGVYLIDTLIVLMRFSNIAGSRSLARRKILSFFLLLQYVPRILRVYLSAKDLERSFDDSITGRAWVKGLFNFFLYVIAAHVFGGFWYFYSIYRETACWHHACESYVGCVPGPFDCRGNIPINNLTFIHEFCPVDPPKADVFNFGIFAEAIESRLLVSTNFLNKFSHCFWWGLRNLSSFGSNLQTSSNTEENLFAVLISILGLLLFLYLIGNLQTYMQLATENSEKLRSKIHSKKRNIESYLSDHEQKESKMTLILNSLRRRIKRDKDVEVNHLLSLMEEQRLQCHRQNINSEVIAECVTKLFERNHKDTPEKQAELWMKNNKIHNDAVRERIKKFVKMKVREGEDVDVDKLLSILPSPLGKKVKKILCSRTLQKVPELQNMDKEVYSVIYAHLKPVVYQENTYIIREGEPLYFMLFIAQGVVWRFGSTISTDISPIELHGDNFYGEKLLNWLIKTTSYANFPVATCNIKSQTKVEAFILSSIDLEDVLFKFSSKFRLTEDAKEALSARRFARKIRHEH